MARKADVRGVETFAVGIYPGDEPGEVWTYTAADLAEITRNFALLSTGPRPLHRIPVVVTHDGVEAHGWVQVLRQEGDLLFTDWTEVDPDLREAIEAGRFKKVSAEIRPELVTRDGRRFGQYLHRVAVLGADIPRVKGLADIPTRFVERAFCFAEVTNMADDATTPVDEKAKAVQAAFGLPDEFMATLTDDQLEMLATAALAQLSGAAPATAATAMQEGGDPTAMTREELIAALVELGQDMTALEAMSDDELRALYTQLSGEGTAMSEKTGTKATPAAVGPTPNLAAQFAELRRERAALRTDLALARAERKASEVQRRQRLGEETRGRVHAFCERMKAERRMTPANADEGGPERERLLRADAVRVVRRFSEGGRTVEATELDLQMREIESRPAGYTRLFGDQIPQSVDEASRNRSASLVKLAEDLVARRTPTGKSLEQKLNMLPPPSAR